MEITGISAESLLWISILFVLYTYTGYPFLLKLLSLFRPCAVTMGGEAIFSVSIVIAAFNEEKNIDRRLANILLQRYPQELLEIIVVSDGSSDATCNKLRACSHSNVRLVELERRSGKASAINAGIAEARGKIIVFTDARQEFEPDAISRLIANFNDPGVGCVSGELHFFQESGSTIRKEMGAYWKYEKWVRKMESSSGSVVGATGAIYAIRRELFEPLPVGTILDDVLIPLAIVQKGYRTVFEGAAAAFDSVSTDVGKEWQRKVRTLAGNWQLLTLNPDLCLPWRNRNWWRFISHKIMRLLVPFALISLFICSMVQSGWQYRVVTALQALCYVLALIGLCLPVSRGIRLINFCYFFLVMNAAAVAGLWIFLTGQCTTVWKSKVA